jgi:hypothetical protein
MYRTGFIANCVVPARQVVSHLSTTSPAALL